MLIDPLTAAAGIGAAVVVAKVAVAVAPHRPARPVAPLSAAPVDIWEQLRRDRHARKAAEAAAWDARYRALERQR